jgi:hypothetical protein
MIPLSLYIAPTSSCKSHQSDLIACEDLFVKYLITKFLLDPKLSTIAYDTYNCIGL